jgi:hypothetical protein
MATTKKKPRKKGRKPREERTVFKNESFEIVVNAYSYAVKTKKNKTYYFSDELSLFRGLLRHQLRGEIVTSGLSDIGSYILVTERAVDSAISTIKSILDLRRAE